MKGIWFSSSLRGLMLSITGALVFLVIVNGNQLFAQEQRVWRDNTGTFEVEATLQSFEDEAVVLKLVDGRTVTVPFRRLSDKDLEYARNVQKANAIAKQPVPKPKIVEPKPAIVESGSPLVATKPKPSVPAPDPTTAPSIGAKHVPPPTFSLILDPEFGLFDEPPADWIPAKPKSVTQLFKTNEPEPITLPPNPEKLKLIGISPPESIVSRPKIAASPVSEKHIWPETAEKPESNALSLIPEPDSNVGPSEKPAIDPADGSSPPLSPATHTGPRIIAPERAVASESGKPADPTPSTVVQPEIPVRPSMAAPLQAGLNSLLAEMKVTTDNEVLRSQLVKLSQYSVPPNDPPTLEVLRQHMKSTDKYIRETVLKSIISLSSSSRLDSETLKLALVDESQAIRWTAYDMIIADPRPDLLPLLLERAPDYDRSKILSAIGSYGVAAEPLLWPLLDSPNASFRLDITRLLSDIGTEKSLPYLTKTAENNRLPLVEVLQAKSSIRNIEARK